MRLDVVVVSVTVNCIVDPAADAAAMAQSPEKSVERKRR